MPFLNLNFFILPDFIWWGQFQCALCKPARSHFFLRKAGWRVFNEKIRTVTIATTHCNPMQCPNVHIWRLPQSGKFGNQSGWRLDIYKHGLWQILSISLPGVLRNIPTEVSQSRLSWDQTINHEACRLFDPQPDAGLVLRWVMLCISHERKCCSSMTECRSCMPPGSLDRAGQYSSEVLEAAARQAVSP